MKNVTSAGIVPLYNENGIRKYLILQHAGKSAHWDFPKGKVETGENMHQAALRELYEEAGITAEIVPGFERCFSYYFRDYGDGQLAHKLVYFYIGMVESASITLSFEHQAYAWLDYSVAREYVTYENSKKLLDDVESFLQSK